MWAQELLLAVNQCLVVDDVFKVVCKATVDLGFEKFAYVLRLPFPIDGPPAFTISNYPAEWQLRYAEAGYWNMDPSVLHCKHSQIPVVWNDALFARAPAMQEEARAFGLSVGWSQSVLSSRGAMGIVSLARSGPPLTATELNAKEAWMRSLADSSHRAFLRVLGPKMDEASTTPLTEREVEVLKWIAAGKTSKEASKKLRISVNTVNFHVKNSITKLQSTNKTAAVVRAALLGLLR